MRKALLWIVVLGILMVGLAAGPDLWAAPGQNPVRQTVPTRTPPPPPTQPPSPRPEDQPTPHLTAAQMATSAGRTSSPVLPQAGGRGIGLHLGAAMIVVGLFVLAVVRRRG